MEQIPKKDGFYSQESERTLHLTKLACSQNKKTDEKFTNTSHSRSTLTVALMLAALSLLKDKCTFFFHAL